MPKIIAQQKKVSRERPVTERARLILMTMRANPKVCTVPANVKISENWPSLKTKYSISMMTPKMTQQSASSFLIAFIIIKDIKFCTNISFRFLLAVIYQSMLLCIIVMKQQLQNNREELISHIEAQLSFLKQKRDSLLANSKAPEQGNKTKISSYLQGQHQPQRVKPLLQLAKADLIQTKTQLTQARNQARQQAEVLKQLYERKRQLESIGIIENDPDKIKKIFETQQTAKQIQNNLIKSKKIQLQKQQRHKIIQEELSKAQSFLRQSKKAAKGKSLQSQYAYSQLLQGKQQKLSQYQQLLNKNKLTILQKEKMLEMTFQLIKQHTQRVSKSYLQGFLLGNQQFCRLFSITKEEIMRDLQVHSTEEAGFLSYHQFYEFIKSVEITNKTIKPNLRYEGKGVKQSKTKEAKLTQTGEASSKEFEQYIKKVYLYLDQKRQKIVERQRLVIAFSKLLLFDEKKAKSLKKQAISSFSLFIRDKRDSLVEKSYYKSLDLKYIGLQELLQLHKQFLQPSASKLSDTSEIDKETQQNNEEQEQVVFLMPEMAKAEINSPTPEENDRNDFQRYGWGQDKNQTQKFGQLSQLDKYYKQMRGKYGNQIHWDNHKVYQQDFKRFNQCIAQMKQNHPNSQQLIGLSFTVREEEEELQSSQQM